MAQAAVLNVVEPLFENEFEDVSFAYRKGRSVKDAAMRIKDLRQKGYRYVVEADIDAFFDNIDHSLLLDKLKHYLSDQKLIHLLTGWIKAEVYDGKGVFIQEKGIPQGTVVSPILANLFLDDFDEAMIRNGFLMVRYSDDFILLAKSQPQALKALELSEKVLAMHHLRLDEEDTGITDFEKGFKYLGLIFMGDSILAPFDRPKKERKVLYMPPPLDLKKYFEGKSKTVALSHSRDSQHPPTAPGT